MTTLGIPRQLGHIWVGDRPAPVDWMQTWRDAHPDWTYTLYDNAYLMGRRWRNQPLINEYFKRHRFEGVSDLMRYEILLEHGGFLPEADSICLHNCAELFDRPTTYSVFETYPKKKCKFSPYLAAPPDHPTLHLTVDVLHDRHATNPAALEQPWISVGNLFLRNLLEEYRPEVHIFPAYTFVPQHKDKPRYDGPGKVYADHLWGSTMDRYGVFPEPVRATLYAKVVAALATRLSEVAHAS